MIKAGGTGPLICNKPGLEDESEITFIRGVRLRREDNQTSLKEHLDFTDSIVCHNRSLVLPLLRKFVYPGKEKVGKKSSQELPKDIQPWRGTSSSIS